MKEEVLVSVCMITYNHEKYLAQAIEGVLMQEANFKIELVIGEDCSTDNTRKICELYANNYPDVIKLLPSEKNLGLKENYIRTLKSCSGKYVAYCEGDDYWVDNKKLQLQYDFLEKNPDFSLVHHDDFIQNERAYSYEVYSEKIQNATTEDIIPTHFISSLSLFFRNIFKPEHYDLIKKAGCMDLGTELILSLYGKFHYIDKKFGVYRLHPGGVTASYAGNIRRTFDNIIYYNAFNTFSNKKYELLLQKKADSEIEVIKKQWHPPTFFLKLKQQLYIAKFLFLYYPGNINKKLIRSFKEIFLLNQTFKKTFQKVIKN